MGTWPRVGRLWRWGFLRTPLRLPLWSGSGSRSGCSLPLELTSLSKIAGYRDIRSFGLATSLNQCLLTSKLSPNFMHTHRFNSVTRKCDCGEMYQSPLPAKTPERSTASSDTDIAEREGTIRKAIDRMMRTQPLISRIKELHKGENWSGVDACPTCGAILHLTHAASNGHVHGHCETKGCVSFME